MTIGIDLAKKVLQVHGVDERGMAVLALAPVGRLPLLPGADATVRRITQKPNCGRCCRKQVLRELSDELPPYDWSSAELEPRGTVH